MTPSGFYAGYESELAHLLGVEHAIVFAYSRHALTSLLIASGAGSGGEVLLSPLTCKVVPLALMAIGLRPVYADISERTLNLDAAAARAAIRSDTRAVLFQHTYGQASGLNGVVELASERGLPILEDCAQCLPLASLGRLSHRGAAAFFSNNLRKPLPAGSGGVATTADPDLARRVREIRDSLRLRPWHQELALRAEVWVHGHVLRPSLYWPLYELNRKLRSLHVDRPVDDEISTEITGRAFRPSPFQQRVGSAWLKELDGLARYRMACCAHYSAALRDLTGVALPCLDATEPLYYFPVLVRNKRALLNLARRRLIELIAWPLGTPIYPVEEEAALVRYGYRPGQCPVAEAVASRLVGLPTDASAGTSERNEVIALLREHDASA